MKGDLIEARLLLPQGTPLAQTERAVAQIRRALEQVDAEFSPPQPDDEPLVRQVSVRYNFNQDAYESGPHLATVTADLLNEDRLAVNGARILATVEATNGMVHVIDQVFLIAAG